MAKEEAELLKLLETILHRRAIVKQFETKTKQLEAQLQMAMNKTGRKELPHPNGGNAIFRPSSSVKINADIPTLLKTFDPRTLAALLNGATLNATKQGFLTRAYQDRNFGSVLETVRSERFTIEQPRSQEQQKMIAGAIQADVKDMEKKAQALVESWTEAEGVKPLPENPAVDEAVKKPAKKKAAKKKAAKKKSGKKGK